jgi:hypothetical protein
VVIAAFLVTAALMVLLAHQAILVTVAFLVSLAQQALAVSLVTAVLVDTAVK